MADLKERTEFLHAVTRTSSSDDKALTLRREWMLIGLLVSVGLILRVLGLAANPVNAYFDEGVYLSLMQIMGEGKAAIYKDIIFGHPPAVIWVGAWLWPKVGGSLFALRLIYALFCMTGFIPVYAIARKFYGVRAALITLFLLMTSPGFANWQGRTVFMELPQNVFLFVALWILVCVPRPRPILQATAGALVGFSFLIKESAIPVAFAMGAALLLVPFLRSRDSDSGIGQIDKWAWLWFSVGFLAAMGALLAYLSQIPNCLRYFVGYYSLSKNSNDTYQVGQKIYDLTNGFFALSLSLTFGLLGTLRMLRGDRSRPERFMALYAIGISLILFVVPNRFYWRYLMPAVPIFCMGFALWWTEFTASPRPRFVRSVTWTFAVLFGLVHIASVVQYHTKESRNPAAYHEALHLLRQGPGPIFTFDPIWNVASGQLPYIWPHLGGDVHGRKLAMETDTSEVLHALSQSPTVVLNWESMQWMPKSVEQQIRQNYTTVFQHEAMPARHYVEILRRK